MHIIRKINIYNFDISNVKDVTYMFHMCISLNELNLANFTRNILINIDDVFYGCPDELKMKIKKKYNDIKN